MKWFHFTDYVGYIKILSKGKLLNYYSILEEDIAGLENINLIKSIHEKNDEKELLTENKKEKKQDDKKKGGE